jgi:NADPH-ferrihemoprotein reductase
LLILRKVERNFNFNLKELEEYSAKGALNLRLAFSRDQAQKVYVTHLLEQDSDLVWNVIGENKGHLYICG